MSGAEDGERIGRSELFTGFAWPVPRAFAAVLGTPRFEPGDVFYRSAKGYGALVGRMPKALQAIQVRASPRSRRARETQAADGQQRTAWDTELVVELVELDTGRSEVRTLTQGKLFTALWRGDMSWLEPERDSPPPPRNARELQSELAAARPAFADRGLPEAQQRGCRFLFVVDQASDASLAKATAIEAALHSLGPLEVVCLTPVEAGVAEGESYHPTLEIRGCFVAGRSEDEVRAALRTALYAGGRATDMPDDTPETAPLAPPEADAEKRPDRFSLARHGLMDSF